MFIKLHTDRATAIRVNVSHIISYSKSSDLYQKQSTSLKMINGNDLHVIETPEQIDRALSPTPKTPEPKKEESKSDDEGSDYMYNYGQY